MERIESKFGFETTAKEVVEGIDLTGKRAIVTGGASGIGVETARALAGAGAEVTIAVRNLEAGEATARDIRETEGVDIRVAELELLDLDSVRAFVEAWEGPLDILVNNAGVMAIPELTLTSDGWETQFATNHLGHFALTTGLHDALAAADGARVVSVSSAGHLRGRVEFDDINFENREYEPWAAYGQSKTANVLLSVGITERWADDGITSNALMPGGIMTNLQRHITAEQLEAMRQRAGSNLRFKTPEQGAATTVYLAASPEVADVSGRYFEDVNEAEYRPEGDSLSGSGGVAWYALDKDDADRLWELSEKAVA